MSGTLPLSKNWAGFAEHLHWAWGDQQRTAQVRLARVRLDGRFAGSCRLLNHAAYIRRYADGKVSMRFESSAPAEFVDRFEYQTVAKEKAYIEFRYRAHLAAEALLGHAMVFGASAWRACVACPSIARDYILRTKHLKNADAVMEHQIWEVENELKDADRLRWKSAR